jgi:hypothetical protein
LRQQEQQQQQQRRQLQRQQQQQRRTSQWLHCCILSTAMCLCIPSLLGFVMGSNKVLQLMVCTST